MCSYKNLAILSLAASFVSPALSAPDSTNQQSSSSLASKLLSGIGDAAVAVPVIGLGAFYTIDRAGAQPVQKFRPISTGTMTGRTLGDYNHTE